jgi:hypothetical protein
MRIVQGNLCLRFYRSDGWTREAVRQLLDTDQRLDRVLPRYRYYDARDKITHGSSELDDGEAHDDCEYFAVYDSGHPFSSSALANHEVILFDLYCQERFLKCQTK